MKKYPWIVVADPGTTCEESIKAFENYLQACTFADLYSRTTERPADVMKLVNGVLTAEF